MKNQTFITDYGEFKVTYWIESDVDSNSAVIEKIDHYYDFELHFDIDTLNDIKFICECDFADRQFKHYAKTGESV